MDDAAIAGNFKGKKLLITGSTGFLGTLIVEKILRVQPDVEKLYLLVRASDDTSAKRRVLDEVTGKDVFLTLKEIYGNTFDSFVEEKVCAVRGDVASVDLGISSPEELWSSIDVVVNAAAASDLDERYDTALSINALGAKHVCQFATNCSNLKIFIHVSNAYVQGKKEGLLLEKPLESLETMNKKGLLDIDAEVRLADDRKRKMRSRDSPLFAEKNLKELGMQRARTFGWPNTFVFTKAIGEMLIKEVSGDIPVAIIRPTMITSTYKEPLPGWIERITTMDDIIACYGNQTLNYFAGDLNVIVDVIPGDMVVNAMLVAMAVHSGDRTSTTIYHVGSSVRNPIPLYTLMKATYLYVSDNPWVSKDPSGRVHIFVTLASFHVYMGAKFRLPLEALRVLNCLLCGMLSARYNQLKRKYKLISYAAGLYIPYTFLKRWFDDTNLQKLLKEVLVKDDRADASFNFDPKSIDLCDYIHRIHIPAVLKYSLTEEYIKISCRKRQEYTV